MRTSENVSFVKRNVFWSPHCYEYLFGLSQKILNNSPVNLVRKIPHPNVRPFIIRVRASTQNVSECFCPHYWICAETGWNKETQNTKKLTVSLFEQKPCRNAGNEEIVWKRCLHKRNENNGECFWTCSGVSRYQHHEVRRPRILSSFEIRPSQKLRK